MPISSDLAARSAAQTLARQAQVDRLLRAAARPLAPITGVMAVPPTRTEGAAFSNSGVVTSASAGGTAGSYRFSVTDSTKITTIGLGGWGSTGQYQQRQQLYLSALGDANRKPGNGCGIMFGTDAQVFDIQAFFGGQPFAIYVTDLIAGTPRQRASANDYAVSVGLSNYNAFDFGSPGLRIVEVYPGDGANLFGVNVPTGYTIWPTPGDADAPQVACLWDSYGQGAVSDTGIVNNTRLNTLGFFGERMGLRAVNSLSTGGTGVIATNLANGPVSTSFAQRIANGDLDWRRIGHLDLVLAPTSLNDYVAANGGTTDDVAFGAAYRAYITGVMAAQPKAIIAGWGPEFSNSTQPPQSRYDAARGAFAAAAAGATRMLYLDNGPTGSNWQSAAINTRGIGPDNAHPTKFGAQALGYRIADDLVAALRGLRALLA